jgi:uncharacterized protein
MDPVLVAFGLGVGVLVGTTGMGGGSLMTPLLILVFGIKPVVAVGTDLAYAALTKTVGGWRHLRKGTVDKPLALWLALGSVPGGIGGVALLSVIRRAAGKGFDDLLVVLIAGALLLTGLLVLARALLLSEARRRERTSVEPISRRHKIAAVALGFSVGCVLGITSAGSGTLIAVGLIVGFRLTPLRVVGTDVFHAAILLWAAALGHLVSGNVDLGLAANILVGSIPGVWIGTSMAARLPERGLRPALGIVLLASSLALLPRAGVAIPVAVIVGVPAAAAALTFIVFRARPPATRGAGGPPVVAPGLAGEAPR